MEPARELPEGDKTPRVDEFIAVESEDGEEASLRALPTWSGWLLTADAIDAIVAGLPNARLPEDTRTAECVQLLTGTATYLRNGLIPPPKSGVPSMEQLDQALKNGKDPVQNRVWRCFRVVEAASRDYVLGVSGIDEYQEGSRPHARHPAVELGLAFMLTVPLNRFPTATQCLINCSASFGEWRALHWCAAQRLISLAEFKEGGVLAEATKRQLLLQFLTPRQQSMLKLLNHSGTDRRAWANAVRNGWELPTVPWAM